MSFEPTILYRVPGPIPGPKGHTHNWKGVTSEAQAAALLKDGWHPTLSEAVAAAEAPKAEPAAEKPPTKPKKTKAKAKKAKAKGKKDGRAATRPYIVMYEDEKGWHEGAEVVARSQDRRRTGFAVKERAAI